jgi:hypothetical protein
MNKKKDKIKLDFFDNLPQFFDTPGLSDHDKEIGFERVYGLDETGDYLIDLLGQYTDVSTLNPTKFTSFNQYLSSVPENMRKYFMGDIQEYILDKFKQVNIPASKIQSRVPAESASGDLIDESGMTLLRDNMKGVGTVVDKLRNFVTRGKQSGEDVSGAEELLERIHDTSSTVNEYLHSGAKKIRSGILNEDWSMLRELVNQGGKYLPDLGIDLDGLDEAIPDIDKDADDDATPDIDKDRDDEMDDREDETDDETDDEPEPDPSEVKVSKIDPTGARRRDNNIPKLRPQFPVGGSEEIMTRNKAELSNATRLVEGMLLDKPGWGNGQTNSLFLRQQALEKREYTNCILPPKYVPETFEPITGKLERALEPVWTEPVEAPVEKPKEQWFVNAYENGVFNHFRPKDPETVYPSFERKQRINEYPDDALRTSKNVSDTSFSAYRQGWQDAMDQLRVNGY